MKNKNIEPRTLITSIDFKQKPLLDMEKSEQTKLVCNTMPSFPIIRSINSKNIFNLISNHSSEEDDKFFNNMRIFVAPLNKSNLEKKEIQKIKKNLKLKKFRELHKYKLEINPNNYYHNYGLNKFITITNKKRNKTINNDYRYNNISSYNNLFKIKEANKENKKNFEFNFNKNKKRKELLLLKSVPNRIQIQRNNNGILKCFNNSSSLVDENSIWRVKNINEMIPNSINLDFIENFLKNSKSMGKIKIIK